MKIHQAAKLTIAILMAAPILRADEPNQENTLESVTVQATGRFSKVILQSTRSLKYRDVKQESAVVLYMLEPTLSRKPPVEKTYSDLVDEIRYTYKGNRTPLPGGNAELLEFVTIHLKEAASSNIVQKDWLLAVELRRGESTADVVPELTPGNSGPAPASVKQKGGRSLPPNPGLADFLEVGLTNHAPLRIARDELRLANSRYIEALRNMLPSVTGKFSQSTGHMIQDPTKLDDDVRFDRKEQGVEMGMALFHSGQNVFALKQASYQKRVAQQNLAKTKSDITFEIRRAYFNMIKAQRSLRVRRELNQRTEKIIEVSRKKKQLGLITQADALGAESLYSQSYYRLLSDEKELEIARLKLSALLNTNDPLPDVVPEPKESKDSRTLLELSVPPESLIQLGLSHRPELLISEYTAAAQHFGARAALAKKLLMVDGTFFSGRAGGAFEDQPIQLRYSWNAGLQGSLYFGGNTVKGARTREHTVPDFGETTATDIAGYTASVGLLDALRTRTDYLQARIERDKAFNDRNQARRNVEIDVREAYYNIQKGKIQIKGAEAELDYREKELDIARQKERMNLIEPAQSLAAESSYGDAVANHEEALSFYQVSLAGLERAVGMPLESIPEFR